MGIKRFFEGYRWVAAGCVSLAGLALLAAIISLCGYGPRALVLRNVEGGLSKLPDTEILPQMRRMAELGDEGIAAVAGMLASDDELVAEAAQVVLSEQLDRWRSWPVEESAPRAIQLARVLASVDPPPSSTAQRSVRDLGMQLLLFPAADRSQAEELVTHCERILDQRTHLR
jgi:hypothetical protein